MSDVLAEVVAALADEVGNVVTYDLTGSPGGLAASFFTRFKGKPRDAHAYMTTQELADPKAVESIVRRLRRSDFVENGTPEIAAEVARIEAAQNAEEASEAAIQATRAAYASACKAAEYAPIDGDLELYDAAVLAFVQKGAEIAWAVKSATALVKGRRAMMAKVKP